VSAAKARGELRIVGGRFRGRRLPIPDASGLRPTPDRVRETLFNWLAPVMPGARCLDAFAGSGALGFEAVSRGAGEVVLIEESGIVVRQLQANASRLGIEDVRIVQADAIRWLEGAGQPFDVVFLDPPFARGLWSLAIERLACRGWVRPGSRIYVEAPTRIGFPELPSDWELVRDKIAGQVRYGLAVVGPIVEPQAGRNASGAERQPDRLL
jgi:16S rRNA (guanine966-N2)-methyltransferase